jgi:histone deacetylase 11
MTAPRIIYSPEYDITIDGLVLTTFEGRKGGRAWRIILEQCPDAASLQLQPAGPVSDEALRLVHPAEYLQKISDGTVVAAAIESAMLELLPAPIVRDRVMLPLGWQAQGTIDGARAALQDGAAINLGGGFHHALPDRIEGFSFYSDIPIAIETMRREGRLAADANVAIVDLDVHRGAGFQWICRNDERVHFFDIHNSQIYPGRLNEECERWRYLIGMRSLTDDAQYLKMLRQELPKFLATREYSLAFYNAGTDVLDGDEFGVFKVTHDGVLERDRFVIESLRRQEIPWVMVTSGGYSEESHKLVAATVVWACGKS